MNRKLGRRQRAREMARTWERRCGWAVSTYGLNNEGIDQRLMFAYLDGYDRGRKDQREVTKRKRMPL